MSFSGLKCVGPFHMYHRPCSDNYKGHGHTGNEQGWGQLQWKVIN